MKIAVLLFSVSVIFFSCKKNDINQTIIRGTVSEKFRGTKIGNYKIILTKSWRCCSDFMCGWCGEEVASVNTDENGNYSIQFNYKLEDGQSYALDLDDNSPYSQEDENTQTIRPGKENVINFQLWKPVKIKLNLRVKNNITPPLIAGISIYNNYIFNTENIYEPNVNKTIELWTKPNFNISIDFWYYESYASSKRHLISIPYTTTLNEVYELDYEVDCSTF